MGRGDEFTPGPRGTLHSRLDHVGGLTKCSGSPEAFPLQSSRHGCKIKDDSETCPSQEWSFYKGTGTCARGRPEWKTQILIGRYSSMKGRLIDLKKWRKRTGQRVGSHRKIYLLLIESLSVKWAGEFQSLDIQNETGGP